MTQKKNYSRYFIILQEDEKGYALASDKMPSGYAKLEMKMDKCKISYYVQNLKKEKGPYYMILICSKKDIKAIIKVGVMNIDDYGRTEIFYEYPVDNIAGSGIAMDKIMGAAIVSLTEHSIVSAMSGFASADVPINWKKYEMINSDIQQNKNILVEEVQIKEVETKVEIKEEVKVEIKEENIFDKYEKSIEAMKVNTEHTVSSGGQKADFQKDTAQHGELKLELELEKGPQLELKIELEKDSETKLQLELEKEPKLELEIELEPKSEPEISVFKTNAMEMESRKEKITKEEQRCKERDKDKDIKEEWYKGALGKFFRTIIEDFDEVEDFSEEIKNTRWYKIPADTIKSMENVSNYNKYTVVYYPMMGYYPYIEKYGHFFLGYKWDNYGNMRYLIYGIPGTKEMNEQPYKGKSGFVTWVPSNMRDERGTELGYWLMFYDFKNSMIVIPKK